MKINKFTHICSACGRQCTVTSGAAYCCPHCDRLGQLVARDDLRGSLFFHDPVFTRLEDKEINGENYKVWRCACGEVYAGKRLLDAGRQHYMNLIKIHKREPGQALRMLQNCTVDIVRAIGNEPYFELSDAATLVKLCALLAEESATLLTWVEDLQAQIDKLENEMPVDRERDEY